MRTPLRYPGGKEKFTGYFITVLKERNIKNGIFVEPYCGGAGAAIKLLLNGVVSKIYMNDIDRSIYAFWYVLLYESERLTRKVRRTSITLEEFDKQKKVQKRKEEATLFDLGFSTFFLNRTTFSGVISGGPIGGRKQVSEYTIDCRFNKEDLVRRIREIAKYKKQIKIFNKDAKDFLNLQTIRNLPKEKTVFYVDPPYVGKGSLLYENTYTLQDHKDLEKLLRTYNKTIYVSYDDCKTIRDIYSTWSHENRNVPHCAGKFKIGREIILQRHHFV